MTLPTYEEGITAFLKFFRQTAPYKHRYEVFQDFVTMTACSLHNGLSKDEAREAEYLKIIAGYKTDDQQRFPKLLAMLVQLLEYEPRDVLGELYMQLELGNRDQGQFFTPMAISDLMAHVTLDDVTELMQGREFITVSEPACGAGGMVLALVKLMITHKLNPADKLWVQCVDVHRMSALMCFIQLTLWNVPAEVIVGNSLSLEVRERWYTPAHHLGLWSSKLTRGPRDDASARSDDLSSDEPEPATGQAAPAEAADDSPDSTASEVDHFDLTLDAEQMGFDF